MLGHGRSHFDSMESSPFVNKTISLSEHAVCKIRIAVFMTCAPVFTTVPIWVNHNHFNWRMSKICNHHMAMPLLLYITDIYLGVMKRARDREVESRKMALNRRTQAAELWHCGLFFSKQVKKSCAEKSAPVTSIMDPMEDVKTTAWQKYMCTVVYIYKRLFTFKKMEICPCGRQINIRKFRILSLMGYREQMQNRFQKVDFKHWHAGDHKQETGEESFRYA